RGAGFELLYDRVETLLLHLRAVILAVALHVADAVDDHVPRLPRAVHLAHGVVDRDLGAVRTLDLGAHRGFGVFGCDLGRQHLETIGREVDHGVAVGVQQRLVERVDETLALLGRGITPVLAEHQLRRVRRVEIRQQGLLDQVIQPGRVLAVFRAVRVDAGEDDVGRAFDELGRTAGIDRRGRWFAVGGGGGWGRFSRASGAHP